MEWQIEGLEALPQYSKKLLESYPSTRVFAFTGEVGAGKTTFIQNICKHLGVTSVVSSPTFALVNEYPYLDPHNGIQRSVYHLDLYRLRSLEEALDIGVEDYLYSSNYCFVEWPTIIEPLLPADTLRIHLEILTDSQRKMLIL
jgi:tRNA threonylcarbamoyladenosine biosynthesis protein TsaE